MPEKIRLIKLYMVFSLHSAINYIDILCVRIIFSLLTKCKLIILLKHENFSIHQNGKISACCPNLIFIERDCDHFLLISKNKHYE